MLLMFVISLFFYMRAFNTLEYRKDKTKARYIRMRDITEGCENFEYMRLSDKRCILVSECYFIRI